MIKKTLKVSIVIVSVLIVLSFALSSIPLQPLDLDKPCPFCKSEQLSKQMVYNGDKMMVILNYKPVTKGHLLIIPKRNIQRFEDLSPEEFAELGALIGKMHRAGKKAFNKPDYVLIVQNGRYGGQTVAHTHMHMIPRGDESTLLMKGQLWVMSLTDIVKGRKPLSDEEMQKEIEEIQHAIDIETENK